MPGVSGSEVAANLLKDPQTKEIPIIFLTGVVTEQEAGVDSVKKIGATIS